MLTSTSRPQGTAAVLLFGALTTVMLVAACAPLPEDTPSTEDEAVAKGLTEDIRVELDHDDGWQYAVQVTDITVDPDLGDDPAPPGRTYVDARAQLTNKIDDRRSDLPAATILVYSSDRTAVESCMVPFEEPMGGIDSLDGCLVAWDGILGVWSRSEQDTIFRPFEARSASDLPSEIGPGETVEFSLRGLNTVDESVIDQEDPLKTLTVVVEWLHDTQDATNIPADDIEVGREGGSWVTWP